MINIVDEKNLHLNKIDYEFLNEEDEISTYPPEKEPYDYELERSRSRL